MSLRKFLEYRYGCPVCYHPQLTTYFCSKKKQEHIYQENSYIVKSPLYGINHKRDYDVGYSFGLDDNSFCIDFYTKDNIKMSEIFPSFLIEKFVELNNNVKIYKFYKICGKCNQYNYYSTNFSFDLSCGQTDDDIKISGEYLGLSQKCGDLYKLFRITNLFAKKESVIEYGKGTSTFAVGNEGHVFDEENVSFATLQLPLLFFSSKDEMINKINKLILFS